MSEPTVNVVGAGLAGCEAAWQIARRGVKVKLYEMKPKKFSPAHHSEGFAELVCSNSLRSNMLSNAVGVLKEEMKLLDSLIMEAACASEVPAGSALAVDRVKFSGYITDKIRNHPLIELGISPRGVQALVRMACAGAVLRERNYVVPEDVQRIFCDVCAHRLVLRPQAQVDGLTARALLEEIMMKVRPEAER